MRMHIDPVTLQRVSLNPADPLDRFAMDFLDARSPIGFVPFMNAVHKVEDVWSVTWLRHGQFQVQLFIIPPNYVIPEHTHPNVDSYECNIGGQSRFSHGGKFITPEEAFTQPGERGLSKIRGALIRVRPNDVHGGVFGESGAVFFSIQHWLNGVAPHCVAADYSGKVMGPHHLASIKAGEPVAADQLGLDVRDAATGEMSRVTIGASTSSIRKVCLHDVFSPE